MQEYHQVPLTLTEPQFRKLKNNHTVQLRHAQISHGNRHAHHIVVHHSKAKKVHTAARNGKGVRVCLTPHELEMSGQGLADFWNKIKSAGSWVKKNVIDTPLYQNTFKPIVHGLVDQGINAASALVGSKTGPLGQKIASDVANAAANKVYASTGAGMRRRGGAIKGGFKPGVFGHGKTEGDVDMSGRQIRNTWPASEFTPLLAPSKYPSIVQHQEELKGSGFRKGKHGGSFRLN